jgi:hypothetical protein
MEPTASRRYDPALHDFNPSIRSDARCRSPQLILVSLDGSPIPHLQNAVASWGVAVLGRPLVAFLALVRSARLSGCGAGMCASGSLVDSAGLCHRFDRSSIPDSPLFERRS